MHCEETIRSYHLCLQGIVLEMQVLSGAALGFAKKKKEKYGYNITLPAFTYQFSSVQSLSHVQLFATP